MSKGMTTRIKATTRKWLSGFHRIRQRNEFYVGVLIVGIALIFGSPLLAQHDHSEPGHTHGQGEAQTTQGHGAPTGHDQAGEAGHDDQEHGEAGLGAAHEGEHHDEGVVHPPTLVNIVADVIEGKSVHAPEDASNPVARVLLRYMAPIYSGIVILVLWAVFSRGTRNLTLIPGKFQNFLEWAVEGLGGFLGGVLGPRGKHFIPFVGSLFIYIYLQNIFGLIPLGFTSTAVMETTAAMAIIVFVAVQITALRSFGFVGYLKHLAGDPEDTLGWCMAPLMFPLHIVGELAKPLSLSFRLFGNMMGGETLLAVFMGIGVGMLAFTNLPVGVPMHFPFIFLELMTTFIQALVFTVLSTIYFSMVLPHEEEH